MEKLHIFKSIAYGVRFNSISVYLNIKELNYVKKNEYFIIKKQSSFGQILVVSSLNGAKPQNHNPTNLKNGHSRFLVSEYPNKSIILKYMINGLSKKLERQTGLLLG